MAATYAKAHCAILHRWRVDGNLYKFDGLGYQTQSPAPEGGNVFHSTNWAANTNISEIYCL